MNEIKEAISYFESLLRYFEDNENDAHWRRKHNQMSREMINAALVALRAQLERGRCENCLYRTALDSHAGLNGCYWHCAMGRGEETKNVWHKYSRHYKDYSLVDLEDFCSSFKPEPPREGKI